MPEVKKMPSRALSRPPSNATTPKIPAQNTDVESESDTEGGEEGAQGLGLVFYDHKGKGRRSKIHKFDDAREAEYKADSPSLASTPNSVHTTSTSPSIPPSRDPDLEQPPLALIERLLEENYRGQAETFVRISSRSPVRSRSIGNRSDSSSSASSLIRSAAFDTPSRHPSRDQTLASLRRSQSLRSPTLSRTFSGTSKVVFEPYRDQVSKQRSGSFSVAPPPDSPSTYGYRVFTVPEHVSPRSLKSTSRSRSSSITRGPLYFTNEEHQAITELVRSNPRHCERHNNCTDCTNLEYAYHENKAMATSLPPEERQKIINNNRSLRNIKNELESLAEHGAISDEVYDTIMRALPAESPLNSASRSNAAPSASPIPTNAFNNMRINNDPPPPAYNTPTVPSQPSRQPTQPPAKPEIARATALYCYTEPDDCTFEVGDQISVIEYMNADWWLGKNLRTGKEGVFPVNYVQVQQSSPPPAPHGAYGNEKANGYGGYPGQQSQQGPPPPGPSNPYDSSVPPMQMANQPTENKPGKGQEMGKKFGKKLGNAAIFGAGATIGGNIVNSIF